jgi:hypothetical protein
LLVVACPRQGEQLVITDASPGDTADVTTGADRSFQFFDALPLGAADILFMIDNSPGMIDVMGSLAGSFPVLIDELKVTVEHERLRPFYAQRLSGWREAAAAGGVERLLRQAQRRTRV